MTLDQHARERAAALRLELDTITVPEPHTIVNRARRRRTAMTAGVVLIIVATLTTAAVVLAGRPSSRKLEVAGPKTGVPAGTTSDGPWMMIPKQSAGIGAASLGALTSDGTTLLLGGEQNSSGGPVTIWRSANGINWAESYHPAERGGVRAIGTHAGTALAIGGGDFTKAFVWRSRDAGETWEEIARGDVFGNPVPNNRPGASVSGLLWRAGWWIAYGGAADGYEGIWISRDGTRWDLALDS
jgi:hypothetical protein